MSWQDEPGPLSTDGKFHRHTGQRGAYGETRRGFQRIRNVNDVGDVDVRSDIRIWDYLDGTGKVSPDSTEQGHLVIDAYPLLASNEFP